jgi:hypothetical protein
MTTQTLIELADEYAGRSQLTEEAGAAARQQLLDALEAQAAEIAALKAQPTEPPIAYLAWKDGKPCYEGDDGVCEDAVWPIDEDDDRTSMPVYTRPQPTEPHIAVAALPVGELVTPGGGHPFDHNGILAAAQAAPARVPLTDEIVHYGQWEDGSGSSADFKEGVRFAEQHHGITQEREHE